MKENNKPKVVIRQSAFETNSSSSHTVVLTTKNDWTTKGEIVDYFNNLDINEETRSLITTKDGFYLPIGPITDKNDEIVIRAELFGHQLSAISTWHEKLQYIIATYATNIEKLTAISNALHNYCPDIIGICANSPEDDWNGGLLHIKVDPDETSNEVYFADYFNWDDFGPFGEVDHQSTDNIDNLINTLRKVRKYAKASFEDLITMIIFSNKFVIVTDTDSNSISESFESFRRSGYFEALGFDQILVCRGYKKINGRTVYRYKFLNLERYLLDDEE